MTSTNPGIYEMPSAQYHRHQALSASGMKMLLEAPAKFAYQREHGTPPSDTFDFGHIAHRIVLGEGEDFEVVTIDAPDDSGVQMPVADYKLKAARERRDAIRASGKVPALAHQIETAEAMAAEVRKHPIAGALLRPGGKIEQSAFWSHPSGVQLRARFDYLPEKVNGKRLILPDYKTAQSAAPLAWIKNAGTYGYHLQAAQYLDALTSLGIDDDPAFVFVVQEKEAPYLISVIELTADDLDLARRQRERAIAIFAECSATGNWPGYPAEVSHPNLPPFYTYPAEEALV